MAIYVSEESKSTYTPLEEGAYPAACYGLVELGDVYSEKYDKSKPQFLILWELVGTGENGGPNRTITKEYGKSLNEKSTLRKDLRAWRGREFTPEELEKFNMTNILGAPCMIQVVNKKAANGNTYSNIASIMTLPKGMPKPVPTHEALSWDFDEYSIDDEAWKALPEWLQNRIKESETYKYITTNDPGHMPDARLEEIRETKACKAWKEANGDFSVVEGVADDELPF